MRITAQKKDDTPIEDLNAEQLSREIEDEHGWSIAEQFEMLTELDSGEDVEAAVDDGDLNENAIKIIKELCEGDYKDNPICQEVADYIATWESKNP